MEMIRFDHVTKTYPVYHHFTGGMKNFLFNLPTVIRERNKGFTALEDISFTIQEGETVAFVGRNGAGKSTLLGLVAGVLRPTKGTVKINKRVSPLLELGGGFHPELSGVENIQLNGVLLGLSRKQVAAKTDEIIEFSGLKEFVHQPIRTYSSGMVARLGFSVVAHLEPELLLIDEVLAVGDALFRKKCIAKMTEFKERGVSVILVSHQPADIELLCSRVIWIENHRIKMDGKTTEVLPAYVQAMT